MRHDLFIIKEERLEGVLGESSPCGGLVTGEEGDVELSIDGEGTYMPKTRAASARGQEDVPDEPRPRHGIWEISGLDASLKVEPDKKSLHQRLHYAGPEDSPVGQSQQGDECVIQDRPCQLRPFFPEGNDDGEAGNVTCFYNTDTEPFTVSGGPDLQLRATTGAGAAGYGLTLGSLDWKSDRIMIAPSVCLPVTQQVVRPGTEELKSHVADRSESAPLVKALNSSQSPETQCRVGAKEKRFFCRFCGKGFNFPKQVEIHQRVHTGEKPFSCTQCRMRFSHSGNLKRHQRVHTGEKPFSCTQCERRFSHLHQLKMHQRVHTGERPYSCTQCGKRFAERSYLRIHQQRNHTALFGIR